MERVEASRDSCDAKAAEEMERNKNDENGLRACGAVFFVFVFVVWVFETKALAVL